MTKKRDLARYAVAVLSLGCVGVGVFFFVRSGNEVKMDVGSDVDLAAPTRPVAGGKEIAAIPSPTAEMMDHAEETPRLPPIIGIMMTPGTASGYDRERNFQPAIADSREGGRLPTYRDVDGDWVLLPLGADESIPQVELRFFELDPAGTEVPMDVDSISVVPDGEYNSVEYGVEGSGLQLAVGSESKARMLEWERRYQARFGRRIAKFDVPRVATGEVHTIKLVFPPEVVVPTPTPIPTPSCLIRGVIEGIPPEELAAGQENRWLGGYPHGVRIQTVPLKPPNAEFQFRIRGEGTEFFISRAGENYARAYIRWVDCGRISIPADADILQTPEDMVPVTFEFGDGVLPPDVGVFLLFEREDSELPLYWMRLESTDRKLAFNAVPGTYYARARTKYGRQEKALGEIQVEKEAVIRFPQSGSGE